jgi:hypothetical protein
MKTSNEGKMASCIWRLLAGVDLHVPRGTLAEPAARVVVVTPLAVEGKENVSAKVFRGPVQILPEVEVRVK